ncbi:MAG: hypothetical protein IBJ10_09880 [Phycisphaerales bacterium]|nr:hypothetical protein [Phycisphaerales bacterium]
MAKTNTIAALSSLLQKLGKERQHHIAAIQEIDGVFRRFGFEPTGAPVRGKSARGGASAGRARGKRPGGQRVQGVKQTLLESLSDTPQSPGELAAKVSKKLGAKVAITTQLHMLKREKAAKAVGRGQWVRA